MARESFVPALNRRWLTPLYDPLLRFVMRERVFKSKLAARVGAASGERILDLGCGTGTLTLLLKRAYPEAEVWGVDIDPQILQRAAEKVARAGLAVELREGSATAVPCGEQTFDHVVSCLMFHHLDTRQKSEAAREVFRVLRPGGHLHLLDLGPPLTRGERLIAALVVHFERTADNLAGRLPEILGRAGLTDLREADRHSSPFGPLVSYEARRPE